MAMIFIDSERVSRNIDHGPVAEKVAAAVRRGKLPKAVIVTDLYGQAADPGRVLVICAFNGNKIITTSGGEMLASDDGALIERARFLSQQARDPAPHYEHSEIGYKYRRSNILAALGRAQLATPADGCGGGGRSSGGIGSCLGACRGLSLCRRRRRGSVRGG